MQTFKTFSVSPASKQEPIYLPSIKSTYFTPFDGPKFIAKTWLKALLLCLFLLSAACVGSPQAYRGDDSRVSLGSSTYNPYDSGFDPAWPFGPAPQQ
jgi:hypothetical protein